MWKTVGPWGSTRRGRGRLSPDAPSQSSGSRQAGSTGTAASDRPPSPAFGVTLQKVSFAVS